MDEGDLALFITREHRRFVGWLYKRTNDWHTSEDIAQLTYISLWRNLPDIRDLCPTVLYRTALHRLIDNSRMRWVKLNGMSKALDDVEIMTPDSCEEWLEQQGRLDLLDQIPTALTETERTLVEMAFYEEKPYRAIAEQMHIPEGTVKRKVFDVRAKLRKLRTA